jgi:translation initiation factor IF-3
VPRSRVVSASGGFLPPLRRPRQKVRSAAAGSWPAVVGDACTSVQAASGLAVGALHATSCGAFCVSGRASPGVHPAGGSFLSNPVGGPISVEPRINDRIRVPEVRLVGPNGEQVGIVRIEDALRLAEEADLDLVEVAPMARPPVAKLMDYGKFKYESAVKAREARKNQAQTVIKEMKLRPKIDVHDYETKKGHVVRFLKEGDKVKITIMFRGREQSRPEMGARLLQRLAEDVVDLGFVESAPKLDGRNMIMVLGPHKKKADFRAERAAGRAHDDHDLAHELLTEHAPATTTPAPANTTAPANTSAPAKAAAPRPAAVAPVAAPEVEALPEAPQVDEAPVVEAPAPAKTAAKAAAAKVPTPRAPAKAPAKAAAPKAPPKPRAPAAKKVSQSADSAETPA